MAGSNSVKKKKQVKQGGQPTKEIREGANPDSVLKMHPVWRLSSCDCSPTCRWSFHKERLQDELWDRIRPKLLEFESMTWGEIFVSAKKQNHSNEITSMNKDARDRLADLAIEADALQSLRLSGNKRLYGFMDGAIYNIIWYDDDHGDNETCVCRSHKKHT